MNRSTVCVAWCTTMLAAISTAHGDGASPTIIVYAPDSSTIPHFRTLSIVPSGSGDSSLDTLSWGSSSALPAVTGYPHWIVAKNSPARNETAAAFYGHTLALSLSFYDGTSWSSPVQLGTNVGLNYGQRAFDLVHENSGDLLVAWWDATSGKITSRTGSSSSLAAAQTLDLGDATGVRWVSLVPQPATNRVLLLALNDNEDLYASFWTGSSWKAASMLSNQQYNDNTECFAASFEAQSREGLIVYTQSASPVIRYRTMSGSTISAEQTGPNMGDNKIRWIRAASNPTTNQVMVVVASEGLQLNAVLWDGSAFGTPVQVATGLQSHNRRQFDIAWQADGANALLVHTQSGVGTIKRRVFTGGAWGSTANGSNGGSTNAVFALFPDATGSRIFGAFYGTDNDLFASFWNGSTMTKHTDLNGTIEGMQTCQAFMVVAPGIAQTQAEADEDAATVKRVVQWQEADPR